MQEAYTSIDPVELAKEAGLVHVSDTRPRNHTARARAEGFATPARTESMCATKRRWRASNHWSFRPPGPMSGFAANPDGHIQATGRDDRGRKQYRYHPRWREVRDETKYDTDAGFRQALPRIRAGVSKRDLARHGLPREKVLATVVRLLETTLIRVGNEEYARQNHHSA